MEWRNGEKSEKSVERGDEKSCLEGKPTTQASQQQLLLKRAFSCEEGIR